MKELVLVIPAHNEEKRIGPTLHEYSKFFEILEKKKELKHTILVVINNTQDKTEQIVKNHIKNHKAVKYIDLKKGGKGYAVIEGFKESLKKRADYIGFVDADMATSPEEYYKLLTKLTQYDGAIAERYSKGAVITPKPTLARYLAKKLFNLVVRTIMLLPYKDTQCGAKVFKRRVIEKVIPSLSMSQWAFDVELLYHANKKGFRIASVPTKWTDKEASKINFWSAGPMMVLGIIRLRIINSPFKIFVRFYDRITRRIKKKR
jgi:glycosyltransferase involved in cell wall biosynthesis